MGLKIDDRIIGPFKFHCQQFAARKSYDLISRIARLIGPALDGLRGVPAADFLNQEPRILLPALMGLLKSLDETEMAKLRDDLLGSLHCEYSPEGATAIALLDLTTVSNIDIVFEGRFQDIYPAMQFALEVNYADFFGMLASMIPTPPPEADADDDSKASLPDSESDSGPSGQSGDST